MMNLRRLALFAMISIATSFAVAQQPAPATPSAVEDPAVRALLDTKPTKPNDIFKVIQLLIDLEHPEAAKPLLVQLDAAADNDALLYDLSRTYGSPALLKLADVPELQPEAKAFLEKVAAGRDRVARDATRIGKLIEQLKDPSHDARVAAIAFLREGRETATQALVTAVIDPARAAERPMLETALAGMGEYALGPLGAMLSAGDEYLRTTAAQTLAQMDDPSVVDELRVAAFAPDSPATVRQVAEKALAKRTNRTSTPIEAAAALLLTAEKLYKRRPAPDAESVAVWHWDDAAQKPVVAMSPRRIDDLQRAARYAQVAAEITGDQTARRWARSAALESLLFQSSGPARLSAVADWATAQKLTRGDIEALFEQAAAIERTGPAVALLHLLGSLGSAEELLVGIGGRPTTLVRAAVNADPTIRFAAVEAIVKLQPTKPFAGSSGVADSLAWFATATGSDEALVVDSRLARGRDFAGMLATGGLRATTAEDLQTAVRDAVENADLQGVFVDRVLVDAAGGTIVARLRADYRTARTPVIVVCEPEELERIRSRLDADPNTLAIVRVATGEALLAQLAMNPPPSETFYVPGPERIHRAEFALATMRQLLESKNPVFNLRPYEGILLRAADSPTTGIEALAALGSFGSAAAQRKLADVASELGRPVEVRQAAAAAFCESVIRFNTLLTTTEISRQYDRYNASQSLDRPTQELLGAILDAVEARAAKVPAKATSGKVSADAGTP